MSCPTCGHTMQAIGDQGAAKTFWCPRCGTISNTSWFPKVTCPELVPRVRELLDRTNDEPGLAWSLGVTESIGVAAKPRKCTELTQPADAEEK